MFLSFWTEKRPMTGMRTCDVEKMQCRTCVYAEKEHIGKAECEAYPEGKPDDVYFDNASCPKYKKGEDLLPYEIQI
mgnify:CR=1 FL=1